jgi:hypothetical protein
MDAKASGSKASSEEKHSGADHKADSAPSSSKKSSW